MKRVILESPYGGEEDEVKRNLLYARFCLRESIVYHNESPYASHLLYTQPHVLDDNDSEERDLGIETGFLWGLVTDKAVAYTDFGLSKGMARGIDFHLKNGLEVEMRSLTNENWQKFKEILNRR